MALVVYIEQEKAEIISMPFVSYQNLKEDGSLDGELVKVEIGFPINQTIDNKDGFQSYVLPSYNAMSAVFVGTLDQLTTPYLQILEAIKNIGGKFTGISYE